MTKAAAPTHTPTSKNYAVFQDAYDLFNRELFSGKLPPCLITMQRHKGALGYFCGEMFGETAGKGRVDEIAMNPEHFRERSPLETLSTLLHEMVHLWQHHFGKPSRNGYHNKEWAAKMATVGLIASATGQEGGKQTGQRMTHYIEAGGVYEKLAKPFIAKGGYPPYHDRLLGAAEKKKKKKKAESKTKFTCEECGVNAWGKPDLNISCNDCECVMLAELGD